MKILRVKQDYPTIQEAVDAALPGDIILVESGVYIEQVNITKSDVKIIGSKGSVLDGRYRLAFGFVLNGASDVVIRGFTVRNYSLDGLICLYGANNRMVQNVIVDNSLFGISICSSPGNDIAQNTVYGSGGYGLYLAGSNGSSVERNRVFSNGLSGIYITGRGAGSDVTYNQIYENNASGILCLAPNTLIKSNTVYGNLHDGIHVYSNSLVENNEVSRNEYSGINTCGSNNTINGNKVSGNARNGICILADAGNAHTLIGNDVQKNVMNGLSVGSRLNVVGKNTSLYNGGYDIVRQRPENYLFDNVCCNSNPPALCTEPLGCWEMEA